jgi:hypothetical protein
MKENELIAIKERFQEKPILEKAELIDFIVASFPGKDRRYARFYLADILKSGIAYPVRTGVWKKANGKKAFSAEPEVDPILRKSLPKSFRPVFSLSGTPLRSIIFFPSNHSEVFPSFLLFPLAKRMSSLYLAQLPIFLCLLRLISP